MKIYLCDKSKLNLDAHYERVLEGLEAAGRESVLRFRQQEDRHRALVREILLRRILHEVFPERRIQIDENEYGRPFVAGMWQADGSPIGGKDYAGFDFNISHSGDLIIIAFGERCAFNAGTSANVCNGAGLFSEGPLGIDVERLGRAGDYKKILRFFSQEEQDLIGSSDHPERDFYRVWTCREAFSKLEGTGLSLFDKEPVHINYKEKNVIYHGKIYCFHEFAYPGYQITLCAGQKLAVPRPVLMGEEIFLNVIS